MSSWIRGCSRRAAAQRARSRAPRPSERRRTLASRSFRTLRARSTAPTSSHRPDCPTARWHTFTTAARRRTPLSIRRVRTRTNLPTRSPRWGFTCLGCRRRPRPCSATWHGQSAPLGTAPARLLLRARLAALAGSALSGRDWPAGRRQS
eukprot:scaffold25397_cov42-Phaeocystis_antarctica.AAC.1